MDTNLMCAAGLQLHQKMRVCAKFFYYPVMSHSRFTAPGYRHARALLRMAADGLINIAAGCHDAGNYGLIFTFYAAGLHVGGQPGMAFGGARNYHESGRVLVQALYYAGAGHGLEPGLPRGR